MCLSRRFTIFAVFIAAATILSTRDFSWLRALFARRPTRPVMSEFATRLDHLGGSIEKLMKIGGTAGVSIGVMQGDSPLYLAQYGLQDVDGKLPVDKETVFACGSLTKAITAAAIGILVDEGKARWDTLVKDILPGFHSKDPTLQAQATLTDILTHRTGMAWADNLWLGSESNVLISAQDSLKYINSQGRLLPFRAQFAYSDLCYELAGHVIEEPHHHTSRHEQHFLQRPPYKTPNVSCCYNALDDASTVSIPCPKTGDDWFGGPTAGLRSSVVDLMKLYKAFLQGYNDQMASGKTSTRDNPLKQLPELMTAKTPMAQPSKLEISYAMGWGRVQLPGGMGYIGLNPGLVPNGVMPIIGKGVSGQLVIYHQGSIPGVLTVVMLVPGLDAIIVVLTNALALADMADWIGQLLLEEVLEVPKGQRADIIGAAESCILENLKWYPELVKELESSRKQGTSPRELQAYTGTYWDPLRVFKIVVTLDEKQLYWAFQGLESEKFSLSHYENDTFLWLQPRNELSRRGRWVGADQGPEFWKARFQVDVSGKVNKLFWSHDTGISPVEHTKE